MSKKSSKVFKAGLGYTIGNYLIKGLSFLTIPIFSRLLSTSEYGIYNSFVAYETILFIFIGMALHGSYKNAKYELSERYHTYISSTLLFIVMNAIVGLVACNLLNTILLPLLGLDRISLNLLVLYSFSTAVITCYNSYIGLEYKYKSYIVVSLINAVGTVGLSIVLMMGIFNENRYLGRIIGTVVPGLLIAISLICFFWRRSKPKDIIKNLKWGLSYSVPLVPHGISQVILTQFDRIMIRKIVGASEAGIYSFAYNIFSIVSITSNSIGTVWEAWVFEKIHNKDYQAVRKVGSLYAIGMLMFSAIVMLLAPEIIILLGPSEYYASMYSVVPIVAAGYFAFLYTIPATIEYYHGKTKYIAVGTVSAAIINVALNLVCIKEFGYIAAAYTTLVSYVAYFLFHYYVAWKIEGRFVFNTRIMMLCAMAIIGINFLSVALISVAIVRWGIALALVVVTVLMEEKQVGFIRKKIKDRRI